MARPVVLAGHRWAIPIERQFVVALDPVAAFSVMSIPLNGKDWFSTAGRERRAFIG